METARLLLDWKADVDVKDGDDWTPLHLAACHGHLEVGKLLIARNATWRSKNKDGKTPFELTFDSRHAGVAHALQQVAQARSQRLQTGLIDATG